MLTTQRVQLNTYTRTDIHEYFVVAAEQVKPCPAWYQPSGKIKTL